MKKLLYIVCSICLAGGFSSCESFLDKHVPQGTLSDEQVKTPANAEAMVVSAYAIFTTAEDINSSFSMWNFEVRSDDAYKGGSGPGDGDVFHQLEIQQGVLTTNWNINDMWVRLYNSLSRVNSAIALLNVSDFDMKQQRLAEMKFLRAYGHFLLKRLYKHIPFVINENLTYDEYNNLSNREFSNDEGWQLIINDLEESFKVLPEKQADKGRPTKAAADAFLAKVYLYKAYHQDDENTNQVTSINQAELQKVIEYTNPTLYANYGATDGGTDFFKPSQNLVNAYRTGADGLPLLDTFNQKDYDMNVDNADPRLFLTVGMPGLPYMFNKNYMMDKTSIWSRSGGVYGYYVSLKQNVDPALIGEYQGFLLGFFHEPHRVPLCRRAADACRGVCTAGQQRAGHCFGEPDSPACCQQYPDDRQLSEHVW